MTKASMPGMYHISSGGHINVGETPLQAAVRETTEEMSIELNESYLYYVGSFRLSKINPNSIVNVYIYRLKGEESFSYVDGEVDSVEWRSLGAFEDMAKHPSEHNLVDQGQSYFNLLLDALEQASQVK